MSGELAGTVAPSGAEVRGTRAGHFIMDAEGFVLGHELCPDPPYPWVLSESMKHAGDLLTFEPAANSVTMMI